MAEQTCNSDGNCGQREFADSGLRAGVAKDKLILIIICSVALSTEAASLKSLAAWRNVHFKFSKGLANQVEGPEKFYKSTRPQSGDWEVSYDVSNHSVNLKNDHIRVHSADVVTFHDHHAASGHSGMSSHISFRIVLSEPVRSVTWDISNQSIHVTPGAVLAARYSTDGKQWMDAYVYPTRNGPVTTVNPDPVVLSFKRPTRELYIGWFAQVPQGGSGFWNMSDTGTLVFTPALKSSGPDRPGDSAVPGDRKASSENDDIHGPRFVPNSFFGTTTHGGLDESVMIAALNDLNIHGARVDFLRGHFEPQPGKYNLSAENNVLIVSADSGPRANVDQLAILHPPQYVVELLGSKQPDNRNSILAEKYAFAVASRFKGKIRHWQIGNEPNMAVWREHYVAYLKACYRGIKRADPDNKVVLAGFAGIERTHLEAVYLYGGKGYFDIIASHSYTRPKLPEEGGYLQKIKALHDVMAKHGDDKPLWVTEVGWCGVEPSMLTYLQAKYQHHRNYSCTEEDQARGLARLYLISSTVPWIERVYFFHLFQEAQYTDHHWENSDFYIGVIGSAAEAFGQRRPKDAYYALRTVVRMISESRYVERIDLGSRIWALVFQRDQDAIVALWSLDENVTLRLEDASMIKGLTSMVGTPILITDNKLRLSGRPIYVAAQLKDLDLLKGRIIEAQKWGGRDVQVLIGLDTEKTRADSPVLNVQLVNTSNSIQPAPLLDLRSTLPWQVGTPVINDRKVMQPGETRSYAVSMTGAHAGNGEVVAFELSALVARQTQGEGTWQRFRYLVVPRRPEGFQADGSLQEWAALKPIELGMDPIQREFAGWRGPDDCYARWYCGWDDSALYFAAEVKDDVHYQQLAEKSNPSSDMMWTEDSIQIAIDVAGDAEPSSNVPTYDNLNDVQFGIALGKDEVPLLHFWFNPRGETGQLLLKELAVVRDEPAKVTRYEAAIPWSLLGMNQSPSDKWMGMNILFNDNDGQDRRGWLEWAPGIGYTHDPSQFPKVFFSSD